MSTTMLALAVRQPFSALPGERPRAVRNGADDDGVPQTRRSSWRLPAVPASTCRARDLVRATLRDWTGCTEGEVAEVAELLVSELVANALLHGRGEPVLTLTLRDGVLRCEVEDEARVPVRARGESPDDAEGGRGLLIVDSLARSWGVRPTNRGKAVWFELATGS
ncbi:ATP-binding protein [Microbispora hainanensis]|jgi:anti-sigma regulatory factor (Ser/Thr protein kinase)|uniref:ATP-binding protein n=1 Tax=Microbispora hainanensis TaxID=568844 RepID=UPI002E2A189C|nr:ATP-binding protein [Microbispora hainanensis]